jgi:hypothetical protein
MSAKDISTVAAILAAAAIQRDDFELTDKPEEKIVRFFLKTRHEISVQDKS